MLSANSLHYCYHERPVLHNVSLTLAAGEMLGIIGPNGAGKSTLLKLLAGLLQPDAGSVHIAHSDLLSYAPAMLAKQRSFLAQGAPIHWPMTAQHVVELGRLPHIGFAQRLSEKDQQAVAQAIALAEVGELKDRPITDLSEGERMRVMFARLLATEAPLMLADEPTAALDLYHQHHTLTLFATHCRRGGGAVLVLHDLNLAARYCDKLLLLHQGRVVGFGTPEQVFDAALLSQVYRVQAQTTSVDGIPQIIVSGLATHSGHSSRNEIQGE